MIGKKINQLATELAPVSTDLTIIGDPISGVSKKITLAQLGAIFSGAVSFYTNLAGFPALGDINVIYCAKDTKKLYLWDGTTYVEVFPAQALLDTYQLRSEKGVSNGYASLDSGGKVPISQLPSSIMEYKGTWNAATNTPTLANGTGDTGDVYICNVAGTVNFGAGPITFAVGDYVIYSGTIWQRSSGAVGTVTSVAVSRSGDALAITGSPITTSGTINIGFAGTGAQYIKGDGTLATFPTTIAQSERLITEVYNSTGATLTKGTIVYINGGQGNLPTVTKALATGDSTSAQTFGVVQADITNNNNGYVVVAGKLSDLDTQAYTEGTQLYLSSTTAGTWTSTKQYAPNHLVYIGIVVRAHPTQGIVEIKIQNGYELDELHNVAAQTPTNNDGLFWESATSLWKNKSIATVLGYTPQPQLSGTGFVKASGTTISYDNSTYVTTDTFQTISASKTFSVGLSLASAGGTNQLTSFINTSSLFSGSGGSNVLGFNSANNIYFGKGLDNGGVLQWNNSAVRYYTLPDATGTIALVGGAGVGTVTSVGLSSATSGVTIGSSPITTSGTITLAIATASGSQQGLLSSTDWTTFNNKQNALTNPVTGTGTTNYLPKFTGTSTIGNSIVYDNGNGVAFNGTNISYAATNRGNITINGTSGIIGFNNSGTAMGYFFHDGTNMQMWNELSGSLIFGNAATTRMTLNASGNLGLGVNPSAWASGFTALQVKNASFWSTGNDASITANAYYDGSNYRYIATSGASRTYHNTDGSIGWSQAPSGTAGNAISFTQAMTLDASGRLGIGTTSPGNYYSTKLVVAVGDEDGITIAGSGDNFLMFADGQTGLDRYRGFIHYNHDSNFLAFGSDGVERLRIASTGAATFSSSVTAGGKIFTSASVADNIIEVINSDTTNGYGLYVRGGGTASNRYVARFKNGADSDVMWVGTSNVGIGTTSPSAKLDVQTSTAGYAAILTNTNGASDSNGLLVRAGSVSSEYVVRFAPQSDASTFFTVKGNGNVGIGTTSPSQRLHVADSSNVYLRIQNTAAADVYLGAESSLGVLSVSNSFPLDIRTNNTTRIWVAAAGNVGIGTTSPSALLHIAASGSDPVLISNSGASSYNSLILSNNNDYKIAIGIGGGSVGGNLQDNGYIGTISNRDLLFNTNNTERIRITSGGNVGIGTTSPSERLEVNGSLRLSDGNADGPQLKLASSGYSDWNIDNFSGNLRAYYGSTEYLRITSGGQISQTTSIADWSHVITNASTTSPNGIIIQYTAANKNNTSNPFLYCTDNSGTTLRFEVRSNGGIANYQANDVNLSDIRTKKEISPLESYWDKFKAIEMVKFKYKDQTHDDFNIGVIAQQVEKVAPEFIDVDGWGETPADGVPLKSVYTADLHHATIKVLQEAMAKIEDLQNQLDTLKNK